MIGMSRNQTLLRIILPAEADEIHRFGGLNAMKIALVDRGIFGKFKYRLNANIGLAMVPIEASAVGTQVTVGTPTGLRDAAVVDKPFVDPQKATPKR